MSGMVFFTDNYQDCSTSDGYRFEFYCKRCGNGYSSSFQHPVTGSGGRLIRMGGDVIGGNVGESARTLSRDAEWTYAGLRGSTRDRALAKAVHEMKSHFRRCDRCGQWVCGQMCWNAERGQCVSCAPRHSQETAGNLAVARSDRSCARCGTALGNARFCGECGTRPADPMTSAHYRLIFPGGQPEESGHADVQVADGALVLIPPGGEVLRVPVRQIESSGPYGFSVLVTLAGGATIELSGLGEMRAALLAGLRDARAQAAATPCGALGTAETFRAGPVDVRVFEDALLLTGSQGCERVGFSFVSEVSVHDDAVTVEVTGREPVVLAGLGRRTSELAGLLRDRVGQARNRTAAFVGALLPELDAMSLRRAAALLRDGVAVPATALDEIRPGITAALLRLVALPERAEPVAELQRRMPLAIGFRQITSVTRAAVGTTPWHDHVITPGCHGYEPAGGSCGPGPGWLIGGLRPGGPRSAFDASRLLLGGYAEFGNGSGPRPMMPRPGLARGYLTPATQEPHALAATGSEPTVLAFVLGHTGDTVVFEILNRPAPVTWLYRAPGPDGLAVVNRALDDIGFTPAAAPALLAGQIPHGDGWSGRLAALLTP